MLLKKLFIRNTIIKYKKYMRFLGTQRKAINEVKDEIGLIDVVYVKHVLDALLFLLTIDEKELKPSQRKDLKSLFC